MSLIVHDPFRSVRALQSEINRIFERDWMNEAGMMAEWSLKVDIREDENEVVLAADVPGMTREEIRIHVENGRLTLSGERKLEQDARQDDYHRIERAYGRFSRTFQLPSTVSAEKIQAALKDGVLTIRLPRKEESKPRAIEVVVN